MEKEVIVLNEARKVTLTAYLQDVEGEFGNIPKRPGILVLPGGGHPRVHHAHQFRSGQAAPQRLQQ